MPTPRPERPRPPVKWPAVSRKPTSEAIPNRSAEMSALLRVGKQLKSSNAAPSQQPPLRRREPRPVGPHEERPQSESDASSQAAGHPLSLRPRCVAAAYRLRRSCHRPRGPIALPRSGCPVRRSRHPAALQCGRCLPLRIHSRSSSSKVCATRTSFIAPLASTAPRGRTRSLLLRHAARARRVPAKGRMGTPHTPFFAREACRRRNPAHTFSPKSNCCPSFRALPKAAGVREPRCPLPARSGFATGDAGGRVHRTRGLRRLARTGVVPGTAEERRSSGTPRWCCHYVLHVRRTRGFRPWPLPTQSGFELFRDAITQALRGQHLYVRHP